MQLTAWDIQKNILIFASKANRGEDYLCPECHSPLRVRKGYFRIPHYYHLSSKKCAQEGKSLEHIQVQLYLSKLVPAYVEHAFPSINRIADIAWLERKLIFEVQCSPISLEEVQSRINDYQSIGYETIFILHDQTFNKGKLTEAEAYLRRRCSFFTNMNRHGKGIIYDQFERFEGMIRRIKGIPLKVHLEQPFPLNKQLHPAKKLPPHFLERWALSKYLFYGEFLTKIHLETSMQIKSIPFYKRIAFIYAKILNYAIKRLCK